MKIIINHPIKAYLQGFSDQDLKKIEVNLSYTNDKIAYQIGKFKKMNWLKRKDFDAWSRRMGELQSQLRSKLVFQDENGLYIRPASIPYIQYLIPNTVIENNIKYPDFKELPWVNPIEFDLYPYQLEGKQELINIKHGNVSIPTGCGKSLILLTLLQKCGLPSVVVTPSKSIFNELYKEFQHRLGKSLIGGYGDGKKDIKKPITIAIGKSLTMLKEGTEAYEFFANKKVMAIDESHTFAAEQLEKVSHGVLSNIPYRFFVSATQTRNDGTEKLLQSIIGKTVVEFSIKEAINKEFLCPLKFKVIKTFSSSTVKKKEPIECKREHFLYNDNIAKIAARIANASWDVKKESTLILVEELIQISMLKDLLKVPFGYIHSSSKKEAAGYGLEKVKLQEQVDKFNQGEVKVLIGTRAIATGTNIFPTHNTINWMGGGSEIITKQGPMGRSTRKLGISKYVGLHKPKPYTMIYDFDVINQPILEKQLKKRVKYYEETGEKVLFY